MKYLCLIYRDENKLDEMSKEEWEAWVAAHLAYEEVARRSGRLIAGEALEPAEAATTVQVRNGKVSITDGPFAEANEPLGGFVLIDAGDLNEALQIASKIPSARLGSVEVRPIKERRQG